MRKTQDIDKWFEKKQDVYLDEYHYYQASQRSVRESTRAQTIGDLKKMVSFLSADFGADRGAWNRCK